MFELPSAKRVKRSKLFSSTSSSDEVDDQVDSQATTDEKKSGLKSKLPKAKSFGDETPGTGELSEDDENTYINYGFEYEFVDKIRPKDTAPENTTNAKSQTEASNKPSTMNEAVQQPKEETYAFNLFAPKSKPNPEPQLQSPSSSNPQYTQATSPSTTHPHPQLSRITIRSPTPSSEQDPNNIGRITKPRPESHYFTSSLPTETISTLQSQYISAAISGSEIQTLSTSSWQGTHLPWRIIHIPKSKLTLRDHSTNITTTTTPNPTITSTRQSRPRPSKKRRIMLSTLR